MKKPKYSLVVPAYNEEKTIAKCLLSLKSQTYKDYEIIVVNNNSKDKTKDIAEKYVKKVYDEKKQGYIYAAKKGIDNANGEYAAICDADTIYPKDWLAKVDKEFSKDKKLLAVYGALSSYDDIFLFNFFSYPLSIMINILLLLYGFDFSVGSNFIFKKNLFYETEIYKLKDAGIDLILGWRIRRIGKIKFIPSLRVYTSNRRLKKQGIFKMFRYAFKQINEIKKYGRSSSQYKEYLNNTF